MSTAPFPGIVHILDDDGPFRATLARVLSAAGYAALGHASAEEYRHSADRESPACLVLDLEVSGVSGLDLQREMARREHAHPIIFLSGRADIPSVVRAMREGALDFLTKPVSAVTLLEAIRIGLERDFTRHQRHVWLCELKQRYARLTPRERQVMAGVIAGRLNKQICFGLVSAERTVKTHRARVMKKMEVASLAELVRFAQDLKIAGVDLERVTY